MALFMDSDFSLLKPHQQKDVVDFKVLFEEQDHSKRKLLNMMDIITVLFLFIFTSLKIICLMNLFGLVNNFLATK